MSRKKGIIKGMLIFSTSTFISRIFGYIRDLLFAKYFGASGYTDAFFIAIRIPNAFRELLGENTLFPAFVPFLYELEKNEKQLKRFINSSFVSIMIISGIITAVGILLTPIIVKVTAPGFSRYKDLYNLTVSLTRISFLYIFFLSLTVIESSVLYYKKNFFYFSFSPVLLNITVIAFILLHKLFDEPIIAPIIGWVTGGIVQYLFIKYGTIRYGLTSKPIGKPFEGKVKEAVKLMIPAAIGTTVYQINLFVDTILASLLPKASISILYYANRLFLLPLSLFAVSLGNVFLPHASELVASNNREKLIEEVKFSIFFVSMVNIPITIFIVTNKHQIIDLLYRRGAFSLNLVDPVAFTLAMYSIGLPFYSVQKILISLYQAHKDLITPRQGALVSIISNALLGYMLLHFLYQAGIALATSISSIVQLTYLSLRLKTKKMEISELIPDKNKLFTLFVISATTLTFGILSTLVPYNYNQRFIHRAFSFLLRVLVFFIPYVILVVSILQKHKSHLKSR